MGPQTIVVFGTGAFAARIVFDLAASAAQPVRVVIAGRNRERLAWLATASAARAVIFARPAAFVAQACDLLDDDQVEAVLGTEARLVNGSFPDVVNPMIVAAGHRVACGIGNVAILANVFAAQSGAIEPGRLKVLGHYQTIAPWRSTRLRRRAGSRRRRSRQ